MDIASLLVFAAVAASVLMSPGPILAALLYRTSNSGRAVGFAVLAGVFASIAACASVGLAVMAFAFATSSTLFAVLKTLGSCYLVWQGAMALYAARVVPSTYRVPELRSGARSDPGACIRYGLLTGLSSPKPVLVYLAAAPQLVSPEVESVFAQARELAGVLLATMALGYAVVIIFVEPASSWLRQASVQRIVQTASAAMLVALGLQSLGVRTSYLL